MKKVHPPIFFSAGTHKFMIVEYAHQKFQLVMDETIVFSADLPNAYPGFEFPKPSFDTLVFYNVVDFGRCQCVEIGIGSVPITLKENSYNCFTAWNIIESNFLKGQEDVYQKLHEMILGTDDDGW